MPNNMRSSRPPREFMLAVPRSVVDMYALHQMVWKHVDAIHRRENQGAAPAKDVTFLYRRQGARVTVRSCGFRISGMQNPLPLYSDAPRDLLIRLAPFMDKFTSHLHDPNDVIRRLFAKTGLTLLSHEIQDAGLATGHKMIDGRHNAIELPYFDVRASVKPCDMEVAQSFWNNGLGRGKRFGFGMPVLA